MPIHDTKEEAEQSLNNRRTEALARIAERGDVVIKDTSTIVKRNNVAGFSGWEDKLILWTESMQQDILKLNKQ